MRQALYIWCAAWLGLFPISEGKAQLSEDLLKPGTKLVYAVGELHKGSAFSFGTKYFEQKAKGEKVFTVSGEVGNLAVGKVPVNSGSTKGMQGFLDTRDLEDGRAALLIPKALSGSKSFDIVAMDGDDPTQYTEKDYQSIQVFMDGGEVLTVQTVLYYSSDEARTSCPVFGFAKGTLPIQTHQYVRMGDNGIYMRLKAIYSPQYADLLDAPEITSCSPASLVTKVPQVDDGCLEKELVSRVNERLPDHLKKNTLVELSCIIDTEGEVTQVETEYPRSIELTRFRTALQGGAKADSVLRVVLNEFNVSPAQGSDGNGIAVRWKARIPVGNDWVPEFGTYNYDPDMHAALNEFSEAKQRSDYDAMVRLWHPKYMGAYDQNAIKSLMDSRKHGEGYTYSNTGMEILKISRYHVVGDTTYAAIFYEEKAEYAFDQDSAWECPLRRYVTNGRPVVFPHCLDTRRKPEQSPKWMKRRCSE